MKRSQSLPVRCHGVEWIHGGKQKILCKVMAALLGNGRRYPHQNWLPKCDEKTVEGIKQNELTSSDLHCKKAPKDTMWRIDYRVGLMLGSNHAVLRLSRQMIMQAGHRKMMEKVWGWGWNQDIFWTGVNRMC